MVETLVGTRAFVAQNRVRVPRLSADSVPRPRLIELIGSRPVTLVSAPAGSGKTMAVAAWAAELQALGEAVAWLSLRGTDDRPFEFWSTLIEALLVVAPSEAAEQLSALSPPQAGLELRFVAALHQIVRTGAFVRWLVIDDVHRLRDPEVWAGLELLLSDPPSVRMVLAGRYDPPAPLHRLRLSGALAEVRQAELAFTEPEATAMFDGLDAALDHAEMARLVRRTEGWAAGLRLAALSVASAEDPRTFVSDFEGDDRAVADYLFAEVIRYLPSQLYRFLLDTWAPTTLSLPLAAELSGRADAGELLEQLCARNALVTRSGDATWFRYHSLLRGYLRNALQRQEVDAPRRQQIATARWFSRHDDPATALGHAVASGAAAVITEMITEHGLRLILRGQAGLVRAAVTRDETTLGFPGVRPIAALAALDLGDLSLADQWLAGTGEQTSGQLPTLLASAVVQRALLGGDAVGALTRSGLLDWDRSDDPDVDLMVLAYRGPARMRTGDYRGAIVDLEQALGIARTHGYDQFVLACLSQLCGMAGASCDYPATLAWSRAALDFAAPRGWVDSPRLAYAYLLAAWTAFQTGDEQTQERYAMLGVRALDGTNNVEVELGVRSMGALARFERATGPDRYAAAADFHALWQTDAAAEVSPALISQAAPQEVRLAIAVGQTRWAEEAAARTERLLPDSLESRTLRAVLLAGHGRIRMARDRLRAALRDGALPSHAPTTSVLAHVTAAGLEAQLGNSSAAFDALEAALVWAAPNHYRRPFIDAWSEMEPLLRAHQGRFGKAEGFVDSLRHDRRREPAAGSAGLLHGLTEREQEILQDLPSVLGTSEIAAARDISINTVKTHLAAIYRKLGVTGRGAAVREARARGLL